jgi:hypothetical protein
MDKREIEDFIRKNNFYCEQFNAWISKAQCISNQSRLESCQECQQKEGNVNPLQKEPTCEIIIYRHDKESFYLEFNHKFVEKFEIGQWEKVVFQYENSNLSVVSMERKDLRKKVHKNVQSYTVHRIENNKCRIIVPIKVAAKLMESNDGKTFLKASLDDSQNNVILSM